MLEKEYPGSTKGKIFYLPGLLIISCTFFELICGPLKSPCFRAFPTLGPTDLLTAYMSDLQIFVNLKRLKHQPASKKWV